MSLYGIPTTTARCLQSEVTRTVRPLIVQIYHLNNINHHHHNHTHHQQRSRHQRPFINHNNILVSNNNIHNSSSPPWDCRHYSLSSNHNNNNHRLHGGQKTANAQLLYLKSSIFKNHKEPFVNYIQKANIFINYSRAFSNAEPTSTSDSNHNQNEQKEQSVKDKRNPEDITIKPTVNSVRKPVSDTQVGRNFITTTRAMREYALDISDLVDLRKFQRRSPYNNEPPITVYLRKDVEAKALSIWKNWDRLNTELQRRREKEENYSDSLLIIKKYNKDYRRLNNPQAKIREEALRKSGRVVMVAVMINGANCLMKGLAWLFTGSHSLFAETIHSLADTCNQLILAYGIRKSIQVPNKDHPYGYHPMRYITSLISGVGIFCTGTGLSFYHGISGILNPTPVESFFWAFFILTGSLISEGGTFVIALNAAKKAAAAQNMSLKKYIWNGNDPTLNVVILEDLAAVLGVLIAGTCMGLTTYFNTPIFDACGSLAIGGLLGVVASFVIVSNSNALIGKSIPQEGLAEINRFLESDQMVRAIHDVKATNMGNEVIRYKAEVDFDGRKLTRNYLDFVDLEALFKEFQEVRTIEECEEFMLKHGENIVDLLGAEVDRIENELKTRHPQVRHVDLEVL